MSVSVFDCVLLADQGVVVGAGKHLAIFQDPKKRTRKAMRTYLSDCIHKLNVQPG